MAEPVLTSIKFDPAQHAEILLDAGRYDITKSDLVRHHCRVSGALTRECPKLLDFDDKRIAKAMEKVGNILVILGYV